MKTSTFTFSSFSHGLKVVIPLPAHNCGGTIFINLACLFLTYLDISCSEIVINKTLQHMELLLCIKTRGFFRINDSCHCYDYHFNQISLAFIIKSFTYSCTTRNYDSAQPYFPNDTNMLKSNWEIGRAMFRL